MTDRATHDIFTSMNLTVTIPDDLARRLEADGADLSRRALEALASEEYRAGRLTKPELRQLLGYETIYELDAFLAAHGIFDPYTMADLERERQDLDRLGF
jgi:post-segregation antitoxin (ccd killing protein)